ncbi:MAG: sulfotransferase, partial [Desulfobacteraceae bacterium]|nr:sulfotransferase [Desulfobacteraceae bacterium]
NSSQDLALFNKIKQVFTPDFFSIYGDCGIQDKTPVFIVGMPRSGTTLVEQILASHHLVFGAGELENLTHCVGQFSLLEISKNDPNSISENKKQLNQAGRKYLESLRAVGKEAAFITDKMPQNYLQIGFIKTILPNAKVIHCVREPMDTCFSIFKHLFPGVSSQQVVHPYAYDMEELGRFYHYYNDLMAHWQRVLPGFVVDIKYENMVSNQEKETRRLLEFCGLEWDDSCLTFFKTRRKVSTASAEQVRQPIYRDSVFRWKLYEKHLVPLQKVVRNYRGY